ncbi:MAG: PD-(D/E)XK nuclease family protein [Bacteroidetes bacterium]|nr:PD-(D/E)XK nuclease family protein [Bacteroidota bacterium]
MQTNFFLSQVAADFIKKTQGDFTKTLVLFPNKRAAVFFNQALYQQLGKTFFAPTYSTISEFVSRNSGLRIADELTLLAYLYRAYSTVFYRNNPAETPENFDEFYTWGKIILHDFDDIDKNLANARQLFQNIEDYQAIEAQFDFLTDEQKRILSDFFAACKLNKSEPTKRFTQIWNSLAEIYERFKSDLQNDNLAYSGMLYRSVVSTPLNDRPVAERSRSLSLEKYSAIAIVGFNVLNKVEQQLFDTVRHRQHTLFYWDYDLYYYNNPAMEAGLFSRENLQRFPQAAGFAFNNTRFFNPAQQVHIISAASEHAQIGYIQTWLQEIENECNSLSEIAIVLGNETLLPAVLASLPAEIHSIPTKVNITMGYPFSATSLYELLQNFLDVQHYIWKQKPTELRLQKILPLLEHPYFQFLPKKYHEKVRTFKKDRQYFVSADDFAEFEIAQFLKPAKTPEQLLRSMLQLLQLTAQGNASTTLVAERSRSISNRHTSIDTVLSESIYRAYSAINRLIDITQSEIIAIDFTLLKQLISKELQNLKIPFEGDPVNGIQIMGVLETRNLDFKHVLVLSASDDFFPNVSSESSFIPHSIRKAYSLNTIDRKIAVFAYYFYRLFHCAHSIHCTYNNNTAATKKKELSRFLQQIRVESGKNIHYKNLHLQMQAQKLPNTTGTIALTAEHRKIILEREFLSPSAFNSYLDCQFQFYCKYVADLKTPDMYSDDMRANDFGNIFHDSAKEMYDKIGKTGSNKPVEKSDIEQFMKNSQLVDEIVQQQYRKKLLNSENSQKQTELNELQKIHIQVVKRYIENLLYMDYDYAPFYMLGTEKHIQKDLQFASAEGEITIPIGGNIDRMDLKNGVLRIVDYKTGGSDKPEKHNCNFDDLFTADAKNEKKRNGYVFQTLLYSWLAHNNIALPAGEAVRTIEPYLLYIHKVRFENEKCTYQSPIHIEKTPLHNYIEQVHEEFDNRFHALLQQLFNTPDSCFCRRKFEDNCKYCDFKVLCE